MIGVRRPALRGLLVALVGLGVLVVPSASLGASSTAAVSVTRSVARTDLVGGKVTFADRRTVTLSVSQTTNLRGRQDVQVSWSGAHPTGGIYADVNSSDARNEEYPFVLLECRGIDGTGVAATRRLTPQTCWTQASDERFAAQWNASRPAPWQLDEYATVAQRAAVVNAPKTLPTACLYGAPIQRWVPFVAADGTTYAGGDGGCAGMAPEASNVGGLSMPSNETFGVTNADGAGTAKFNVWTAEDNASLGCSQSVACALVAVPIMGLSCDPVGSGVTATDLSTQACEAGGFYKPGQIAGAQGQETPAVTGALWWAPSNWRNRITIPLTFAPASNVCDLIGAKNPKQVYGSEMLTEATQSWAPAFCLDPKRFNFRHVEISEPEARSLLAAHGVEAVFDSNPGGANYSRPVVHAPVAFSGFAIGYSIDDSSGNEYRQLRLTPRLLAKLLTESYPADLPIQQSYAVLANNPLDITDDPEFQALNPDVPRGVGASEAAAELVNLSTTSDLVHALTAYLNADPRARAWLDGKPDPWGMVVNPAYKHISLPLDSWPLLDTFQPTKYYATNLNQCLADTPVPYLPLVSAPLANLGAISLNLQFAIANSTTICQPGPGGSSVGERLIALGRESVGHRFLIGLTTLADAARYDINTAALQTKGGTFVSPSSSSLRSAAALLHFDATTRTWPIPLSSILASTTAYPGAMLVYADVPTSGLPSQDAKDYGQLLTYLAGPGQVPGQAVGQLPSGYLPLTAANGLGAEARYTVEAAADVVGQQGLLPGQQAPVTPPSTAGPGATTSTPPQSPVVGKVPAVALKPLSSQTTIGSPGDTTAVASTLAAFALPVMLGIGLVSLLVPGSLGALHLLRRRR